MNRIILTLCYSALVFSPLLPLSGQEEDADSKAPLLEALRVSAERYVEAYNRGDAEALAATYLPEGEITLGDGSVVAGREAIAEFYGENFAAAGESKPEAAMEVDSVRFLAPGVALESGTLILTTPEGTATVHPFTALQVKQKDGTWLTGSVRDELGGGAPLDGRLADLEWLVGDWIIQQDGVETVLRFDWSDFGPYLEGGAESAQTTAGSVGLAIRIGWDGERGGFVSWNHDSEGGYVTSEWTETGSGTWLLRSKGVTSEGEANEFLQICERDAGREKFTWAIHNQTIDGELQPDRFLTAVKRPPLPSPVAKSE